jgi:hypothetical protein
MIRRFGRTIYMLAFGLAVWATPSAAQDSAHVNRPAPVASDTVPRAANDTIPRPTHDTPHAIIRDTTRGIARDSTRDTTTAGGPIHIVVDTTHVDSLALDTLRRAVHRDSIRAVAVRDSTQSAINCGGRRITAIAIRPQPPYLGFPDSRVASFMRRVSLFHATTRGSVIRRFLALRVGDMCVEERRTESERLLRAQPFIQSAHIAAFPDGPDGVRLDVFTIDELAGEIGIGVGGPSPFVDQVRLGNGNLFGDAIRVAAVWARTPGYHDRIGGEFDDFQTFGHPWVLDASAHVDHVGGDIDASMSHPYFLDLQQFGWRVAGGSDHDYFQFRTPTSLFAPTLDVEREYANAGGLFRIGNPSPRGQNPGLGSTNRYSRLALVGAAISHETDGIGGGPVLLTSAGPVPDTTAATKSQFARHFGSHTEDRVNALFGVRSVDYITVRGFDALLGEQDVPLGGQFSAVVGRGLPWLGPDARDIFVSGRLDLAAGTRSSIVRGGFETEARRDERTGRWDGLITSGRAAWYVKAGLAHTFTFSTDAAFGQRVRVPFQLALGDPDGGVRGYLGSNIAGAARAVGRAEYRTLVRPPMRVLRSIATWAVAGFVDGGRVWSGDIPFGVTSPTVASAGVGLLVGIPAASRQLWRVDLAMPLVRQPRAGLELRVSSTSAARTWWTEPPDVTRSRERTVTPSLFSYP